MNSATTGFLSSCLSACRLPAIVWQRHGLRPREVAVFLMAGLAMGLLYYASQGLTWKLLAAAAWLAATAGLITWVGRERFPEFFLMCIFFFPKKTVAEDHWGNILRDWFGSPSPIVLSYFDVVLLPTLVLAGLWLYRGLPAIRPAHNYVMATVAFALFAAVGAASYLLAGNSLPTHYAPIVVLGSIGPGACYLVLKMERGAGDRIDEIFSRYAKWVVVLLFAEYLFASWSALPNIVRGLSMDWRGGFRSVWLGYSVLVAFFAMLGFWHAVRDYLRSGRRFDLAVAFMGLALILSSFERAALVASVFFFGLALAGDFQRRRYGRYMLLLVACAVAITTVEYFNLHNKRYQSVTAGDCVNHSNRNTSRASDPWMWSLAKIKGCNALSASSMPERIALQLRAADVFLDAPLGGYGNFSYFMTSVSPIPPAFGGLASIDGRIQDRYENILQGRKQSNPHNIFAEILAEMGVGVLAFVYLALLAPIILAAEAWRAAPELREGLLAPLTVLLALHVYYLFQATPTYHFLFVFAALAVVRAAAPKAVDDEGQWP